MKIVTIGEIVVEIMATEVDQALSETGTFTGPYPSGAPAIFIDQVAKLGVDCAIISAVGNDGFGRINLDRLKQDGVDVSGISVLDQETTGSAFVTYHADGSRDFIFNIKNAACGKLNLDNANLSVLEQSTHLHIMGSSLFNKDIASLTTKAIEIVKGNQGSVSFDPNIRKELLDASMKRSLIEILKVTDIFMPSEAEITSLSESNNLENAINEYFNVYGVSEIVLKQGEKGAKVFTRTHTFEQKAFPVEEVDPTGAGDCFGGAYVAFRLQSKPIEESLRLATECGSRSVTVSGPMEGTSRLDELSGK
ncbi:putative carbohydrate kinase [Vibrio nigripulchritudo MADA3029]|uniref:sugar kinase n=1 Tax=Vibrio nigripulchritudo TaxID=28173 RepID=UPI0003B1B6AF|nr:sugar kinase [Vibrio nigripulchritudo]BCL72606.1 sugar kinase [Vibrio nigripulchritudo]BDU33965.1 sugar kinase [Vibrio nigripulchritudo]CCN54008.1 putative carbohydrate kinase [Vibrio nigripulchritudo MADA3021]CCN57431.1 putative carbohydrate kinase [Vibrio nigripulchritudo MADA3029]